MQSLPCMPPQVGAERLKTEQHPPATRLCGNQMWSLMKYGRLGSRCSKNLRALSTKKTYMAAAPCHEPLTAGGWSLRYNAAPAQPSWLGDVLDHTL